ncbi:hypothetical protein GCM10028818_00980 [Spirosoma horti]
MDTIKAQISAEPVSQFPRRAILENFVITHDLNMKLQIRVVTLDGESGQPITEKILTDEAITSEQRKFLLERYADQIITRLTDGAFVDAVGLVVEANTVGAISQRDYFQAVTLGDLKKKGLSITDKTPIASLIYALIQGDIANIDNRGGL